MANQARDPAYHRFNAAVRAVQAVASHVSVPEPKRWDKLAMHTLDKYADKGMVWALHNAIMRHYAGTDQAQVAQIEKARLVSFEEVVTFFKKHHPLPAGTASYSQALLAHTPGQAAATAKVEGEEETVIGEEAVAPTTNAGATK